MLSQGLCRDVCRRRWFDRWQLRSWPSWARWSSALCLATQEQGVRPVFTRVFHCQFASVGSTALEGRWSDVSGWLSNSASSTRSRRHLQGDRAQRNRPMPASAGAKLGVEGTLQPRMYRELPDHPGYSAPKFGGFGFDPYPRRCVWTCYRPFHPTVFHR